MRRQQCCYQLIILVGLLLAVVACVGQPVVSGVPAGGELPAAEEAGKSVDKVAVLLPASQTDHGWNQQAADGMAQVAAEHGLELEVAENLGYEDISPVLRDLADRGFDLLICHADGYQTTCPEFAQTSGVKVVVARM